MPPGQAEQVVSDNDECKYLHNIQPGSVKAELRDIAEKKGTQIEEFGRLEGGEGSPPHWSSAGLEITHKDKRIRLRSFNLDILSIWCIKSLDSIFCGVSR